MFGAFYFHRKAESRFISSAIRETRIHNEQYCDNKREVYWTAGLY